MKNNIVHIRNGFAATLLLASMLAALGVSTAHAEEQNNGVPGEWLSRYLGPRSAGLGGAFVALANDPIGYVCHSEAYDEGGYESGTGTNLAKGAGEIMVKQALDLISRIKSGK